MYLISACLAGINCKYNGGNNIVEEIINLVEKGKAVLVCPEQLGGFPTPRLASEIKGDRVINVNGEDVTCQFEKGAQETLKIAKLMKIKTAILKSKSPSCGPGKIYDGTFTGVLTDGYGITAKLLKENGIEVIDEMEFVRRLSDIESPGFM
ncbi:DUF523 domain-containing protein [Aceticella autotrophica]|uniref:DUF523 domain-containing protein n=1 Tax=Aceticella autotrophica TaxID=2755338 RepID=A0A975AXL4_9THEO|nr:DUF523 domain-containing protein [Aceticella autotrophica]QSZ28319.1 DUF523 domain-containing protein [Aceticella autotrophica]